jgi:hypothetical protein
LVLLSPLILVRLLRVAEFGRYREFLLYAGLMGTLVAFGIALRVLRLPEAVRVFERLRQPIDARP